MDFSPPTIFISYSRGDGRAFAEAFEKRLEDQAGIQSWRDLKSVKGGEDIRPQVLQAIEQVKHLVLILTRRALKSDWVRREWTHARAVGRKVSPVLADPTIKRSDLPAWIRRADVYDIADPERWTMLVQVLRGPGETRRVPYMTLGPLPDGFVPRPVEYTVLKKAVLSDSGGGNKAVALMTALRGAGGYGKTTLAKVVCYDPSIRFEFSDGILCVKIGKERSDMTGLVVDLIEKLNPEAQRPGFQDELTAAEHLGELIGEARLLLVIDDVWREAQLRPFLSGGPNCVRLVTTRLLRALPTSHIPIVIDEMRAGEAVSLISAGLPVKGNPTARARLRVLSKRLGSMAQMLAIANGWIRNRILTGEPLLATINRFERRLEKRGLVAFDPEDQKERNRAISACIEASLEDLKEAQATRFGELAILPEDEDIPLAVVEALWAKTGRLDEDEADELFNRFRALSLLQDLDLGSRTLRLHDNMIWYLCNRIGPGACRAAHGDMLNAIHQASGDVWSKLPAEHIYGWRFLIRHLRGAGRDSEADQLLTDYAWIKAKLAASGVQGLLADYLPEPSEQGARLVGRAIALSVATLTTNPHELALQLFGRLANVEYPTIAALIATMHKDADLYPIPRWPGLTSPGAERLRLVGHEGAVISVAFSHDGNRLVTASWESAARLWDVATGAEMAVLRGHEGSVLETAFSHDSGRVITVSYDHTARLWDANTGTEIATLRGHEDTVISAAFSHDDGCVVTASSDKTARLWDVATGTEVATFRGHEGAVLKAVFSRDDNRVITASDDATARVWDAATGAEIVVLRGHAGKVNTATFSPNGSRIVTASDDHTARLWDTKTGMEVAALREHEDIVTCAAFSPSGDHVVTASWDRMARVWDTNTGVEVVTLCGHGGWVISATFSRDGDHVVTASSDGTARLWNPATGAEIVTFRGHEDWVIIAVFSPDGNRVVTTSRDRTARLWDATTRTKSAMLAGHRGAVISACLCPNGGYVVTASLDKTARVWDAATGAEIVVLRGHARKVNTATFSPNGSRIVTASDDHTARLWDTKTGMEVAVLRGHEDTVTSAAFSPDGSRVVTASYDCTARQWDATSGTEVAVLRGHKGRVTSAAFSHDGRRVVTASSDGTARQWDATSGTEVAVLRGHRVWVTSAAFSHDGSRVVTASYDCTARQWDATSGTEVAVLCGHEDTVTSAAFSHDGGHIVTASGDYTVRLWDATTGTEVTVLRGHERTVNSVAFSLDASCVVTASSDRTARLWDAATGTEVARITLDAAVTALAVQGNLIALGDALGRVHVLTADKLLNGKN